MTKIQQVQPEPAQVETTLEPEKINAEAPLGLEFEMPEEVWVLARKRVSVFLTDAFAPDLHRFVPVWASEQDADMARSLKRKDGMESRPTLKVRHYKPLCVSLAHLRESCLACDPPFPGCALLDFAWNELGRRYWR